MALDSDPAKAGSLRQGPLSGRGLARFSAMVTETVAEQKHRWKVKAKMPTSTSSGRGSEVPGQVRALHPAPPSGVWAPRRRLRMGQVHRSRKRCKQEGKGSARRTGLGGGTRRLEGRAPRFLEKDGGAGSSRTESPRRPGGRNPPREREGRNQTGRLRSGVGARRRGSAGVFPHRGAGARLTAARGVTRAPLWCRISAPSSSQGRGWGRRGASFGEVAGLTNALASAGGDAFVENENGVRDIDKCVGCTGRSV